MPEWECRLDNVGVCVDELAKWVGSLKGGGSLLVIEYDTVSKVTVVLRAFTVRLHREWRDYNANVYGTAYYRGAWARVEEPEKWSIDYFKIILHTGDAVESVNELAADLKNLISVIHGDGRGLRGWNDAFDIAAGLLELFTNVTYPWPGTPGNRTIIWDTGGNYPEYEVRIVYYA